tara:strand:+ start:248 stop:913 length:666 start_codon:yes stop_codon:yes gene_type:complete
MMNELAKRIFTSIFLLLLLITAFFNKYILIILLVLLSIIAWIEFYSLISKIIKKNNFLIVFFNSLSLIYLYSFSSIVFEGITTGYKMYMLFLFLICIFSDIGGFTFGKFFKGKKLTKISPNKTVSGSIGSFILSLLLVPFFYYIFETNELLIKKLEFYVFFVIIISLASQLGDIFISYLKRKAKVKDTGNFLPGHGGLLDRIDGMLLAIPVGLIINLMLQL